ncbi:DNA polymerase III subunit beta [Dysgonomonas sp. 511]|uniref:DNA polymerase III subunit beta n=1 Tax=Dysgonomonas sp. 511 TaxID=2302930 RepID=UPI0013D046EC|nr:DNA polymerase III subunit beta [Dysgonomonas sp. 511]NDV77874.1 hypothetical protein [Dysgonomonas sp. 511]
MRDNVKFKVSKSELLKQLVRVSRSVRDKASLPIYTYILFEVSESNLRLTGTDTNIQIESALDILGTSKQMSFCADKTIIDILKTLPDQPLEIEATKETLPDAKFIRVDVNIIHSSGNIVLNGEDSEFFTKMKDITGDGFAIKAKNLKNGLDKTRKFALNDIQRPVASSVFFDVSDSSLTFASSNNKIAAKLEDYTVKGVDVESFILDINSANVLSSVLNDFNDEPVKVSANKNNAYFEVSGLKFTSRLVEGQYHNYRRVFQDSLPINLKSDSKYLSNVINRLLKASDKTNETIRLESGLMETHLSSRDIPLNKSAEESIECECNGEITIGLKGGQLIDMLSVIDGNAVLSFSEPDKPVQLEPETQGEETKLTLLVMPMQIV